MIQKHLPLPILKLQEKVQSVHLLLLYPRGKRRKGETSTMALVVSFEKTIIFMILAAVAVLSIPTSNAQLEQIKGTVVQNCNDNNANYTANSTYLANLNQLTSALSINGSVNGFAEGTVGNVPDRVYGLVLCRGDINSSTCRTCLDTIRQDVLDRCPLNKAVTIWYDYCILRYSSERFANVEGTETPWYLKNTQNINTDEWPRFNQSLVNLLDKLIQYAAYNTSAPPPLMFATGQMNFVGQYPIIYGLVQCTRDLSQDACNQCLRDKIGQLNDCCYQSRGGRVLGQSCNFRYETGTFFSGTSRINLPAIGAMSPAPSPSLLLPPPPVTSSTNNTGDGKEKKSSTGTILAIAIPIGSALVLLLFCFACCLRKGILKNRLNKTTYQPVASTESLLFDLQTVRTATNNFSESNKLGEGGFGVVYKGNLEDGQEIAVKRLPTTGRGLKELKNEVFLLAKLQHKNLVKLLGVFLEEEEKFLVYEYVQNRSLDTILFDPIKKVPLPWERRRSIIEGIGRGMLYLHEESQIKIIHRDLKASNILLDAKMNPKISDFGLARLFSLDQTHANTSKVVGTFGYISPEYAMRGQISDKSDVFSFGVLILEIVTGQKNCDFVGSGNSTNLLSHVWEHWSSGRVGDIVDPSLDGNCPQSEALRCIQIGLMCVQENPSERPTMSEIVLMLSSSSVSVCVPSRPAFFFGYSGEKNRDSYNATSSHSTIRSDLYTLNEVSITEMHVR